MIGGEHADQPLSLVDGVEKAVIADAIPPGLRDGIPKFLDILPDVGICSQLGIDIRGKLALNTTLLSTEVLLKVFPELYGFKDTELSQRAYPCAAWRCGVLL